MQGQLALAPREVGGRWAGRWGGRRWAALDRKGSSFQRVKARHRCGGGRPDKALTLCDSSGPQQSRNGPFSSSQHVYCTTINDNEWEMVSMYPTPVVLHHSLVVRRSAVFYLWRLPIQTCG